MTLKKVFTSKPVLIIEVVILILFGFNVGKEMLKKKAIEREVTALENEITSLESENTELEDLLQYVKTEEFAKREAREKLNLVGPGEEVIVIPRADAGLAKEAGVSGASEEAPAKFASAMRWWNYFFE